jgi:hypothetical protein
MPTSVPINFKCDFPMDQDLKAEGNAWVRWTLEEDAADVALYTAPVEDDDVAFSSLTASQANVATFTLTRTANPPPVGTTKITLKVALWYQNSPTLTVKMHEKIYEMVLTATGTENSVIERTSNAAGTEDFSAATGGTTTSGDVVTPLPVGGITFTQTGAVPVVFGSPIEVTATSGDPNYRFWLDTATPVSIYNAAVDGTLLYNWPASLVTAPTTEVAASASLVMVLKSVPAVLFNELEIFVSCTVTFRDVEGDIRRRALRIRTSGNALSRKLAEYAPGQTDVQASVQMTPIESASGSSSIMFVNPLMMTSAAMAGFAMLL